MSEQNDLTVTSRWAATWWAPIWEFLVHVIVGTSLFALIGIPAVGLSLIISRLEYSGASKFILWGLTGCEYLLFGVDLILFAVFIVRQAWKGLLKLW
jgi:hypothetical protein